jgi:dephospho-CoA kinase
VDIKFTFGLISFKTLHLRKQYTKFNNLYMKLGITGGIGSGKTSVCRVFNVLGIPVFSADTEARKIMNSDSDIILKVKTIVGKDIYISGSLDRMELARLIFNNENLLKEINHAVHPVVFEHFKTWERSATAPYVIMEAAILFESGASELVDRIITVVAPVEERIERVVRRNNLTREQVLERIRNQMEDKEKISLSDYVIYNSEHEMIIPAILKIHEEIMSLR